ncbi:MAG TPA: ATP-dependent RNA helicase HrpA, partial [Mycobacteriales bacterium]|nr:ATP-dependent RNA helicase HrpA [Mycobacteriales bacterium]
MSTPAELRDRVEALGLHDRRRLGRRLDRARGEQLARVAADVDRAEQRLAARAAGVPQVRYPEQLPISQRRDEIMALIREHQVVVVAGETGSGKTTQLPKMCLELGRGVAGLIGHTQPRRIAARAVAERIAEEVGSPLGEDVGYVVRFHDQISDASYVKVMTDGILLAEIQSDRLLSRYDTLIIDEAHERSLNIDFLLGYLKQLLPRRPDLKIIITSATIDPQRFAAHFDDAPVIEVSGRTYPVEVRYRPQTEDEDGDQESAICAAVEELAGVGPGDVLVFLSGEREIRDAADALRAVVAEDTEVLPLYARLSAAEQHRVFEPRKGRRRVVLATNVAETSLTVPGIRYVVDPGTARISRYSQRTKVQRLPIEAISQASATQRAGRCGRVEAGVCIRLYSQEDYEGRPEFTDPEILRTNLASVILQMTALGLGEIAAFPFVEPPETRSIRDGVQLLGELGALLDGKLTPVGRQLAQLPVDPRLGRMVVEADRNGVLHEVLVLAAALSIQDPRERPQDRQQAAAEKHARFADETSDFLAYLNLWNYLRGRQRELGSSAFRRLCKEEFLNHLRIREWQDVHNQLRQVCRQLGLTNETPHPDDVVDADKVHQSLLAGLLSQVGMRDADKRDYVGARGARFHVVPGSALFKKTPRWVVAAELVETNRLWGRVCARVQPEWVEALAGHLTVKTYAEPHWDRGQAAVIAYERVTLYGLPLVTRRQVNYGRIDPEASRDMFLRSALVEGDWDTYHAFFADNRRLLEDVAELEHRARRRDIVVDDQTLYDFYDARIPADVVSGRHFDAWWKQTRQTQPDLLTFSMAMLVASADVDPGDYPDVWVQGDLRLALTYQFSPGSAADGVTCHIPLPLLNRVTPEGFDWQVPGLRADLATAVVKALPKSLRVRLVPAPDTARAVLAQLEPRSGPFLDAFTHGLLRLRGVDVRPEDVDLAKVPDHLRITFRVFSGTRTLADGKDLAALKARLAPQVQRELSRVAAGLERTGLRTWEVGTLADVVEPSTGHGALRGYPALVDGGDTVSLRVLESASAAAVAHRAGVRRLLLLSVPSPVKAVQGRLTNAQKLAFARSPYPSAAALLEDCAVAAADSLITSVPRDAEGFAALVAAARPQVQDAMVS